MAPQYTYVMKGLGKTYPPDHTVLHDIWLSFLPGAKIGVLGLNGAGKSTLLKIMAGVETELRRRGLCRRRRVGRLPVAGAHAQSREGCEGQRRGRRGRAEGGARPLRRRQRHARRRDDARGDGQAARRAGASCRTRSTPPTPGTSTRGSSWRWTRCAARQATPTSRRCPAASAVAWRCAGCCCSRPTCCCSTNRPTTSTPSRWPGSSGS